MSEIEQGGHKISVEKAKPGGSNPLKEQIMRKRSQNQLLQQRKLPIFDGNQKTKSLNTYNSDNIIKLQKYELSYFFETLINAYLNNPEYDQLFLSTNKSKITINRSLDPAELSFFPKSEKANDIIIKAIECARTLLPFTAKSILCHVNYPNCAVEIITNGPMQYNSLIHLIDKENRNLPSVFNINKEVIEFLCSKVSELSSSNNLYRIALTGESLSFSLDDTNKEDRIDKINTSNCQKIFSSSCQDKNRLLLLVSAGQECPPNQPKLEWVTVDLNEDEESIQIASNLIKGIRVRHNNDLYIFKESNEFNYKLSEKYRETYQINPKMKLKELCQNLYDNYLDSLNQEIPIIDINFISDNDILSKREKFYEIKRKINDKYKYLDEKYDKSEVKEKKSKLQSLEKEKRNMTNISYKDPRKKRILDEINSITRYLKDYDNTKFEIKRLNEEKSRLNVAILDKDKFDNEINIKGRRFYKFGVYCFSTEKPVKSNNEETVQANLIKAARKSQIDLVDIEKMTTATIYVSHHKQSSYSPEEFKEIIYKTCKKFSFLVTYCSDYKKINKLELTGQTGLISIDVIYPKFARIIVSEIKEALLGNQLHKLRIPRSIASKKMLKDDNNQEIIENWLNEHKLLSIRFNGLNWIGNKEDVRQAYKLLEKNETLPKFKQKVIPIPLFLKKSEIRKIVEIHNEKIDAIKWDFDAISNCLVVGNDDIEEANKIITFLESQRKPKSEDDLLGCIKVCEEQKPSELQLNVYNKDGSCITNHLCTECIMDTLDHNVNCFFENNVGIDFEALISGMKEIKPIVIIDEKENVNNEIWPKIPIGQLLWNLVNDTTFSDKAKVWLTELLYTNIHSNKEVVTFCPDHPYIILPRPKFNEKLKCTIKECKNFLCTKCNEWHTPDEECSEWEGMRCPSCQRPTEKSFGCNVINCICGAIWCYKCGIGFNSFDECQEHMMREHGSSYD